MLSNMKSVVISFILCIIAAIITRSSTQQSTLQSGAEGVSNTGASATPHRPGGLFSRGLFTRAGNLMAATGAMGEGMREYGMCGVLMPQNPMLCLFMFVGGGGLFN